jgi:hypothetical protein
MRTIVNTDVSGCIHRLNASAIAVMPPTPVNWNYRPSPVDQPRRPVFHKADVPDRATPSRVSIYFRRSFRKKKSPHRQVASGLSVFSCQHLCCAASLAGASSFFVIAGLLRAPGREGNDGTRRRHAVVRQSPTVQGSTGQGDGPTDGVTREDVSLKRRSRHGHAGIR